jgi:hypothetical protein
MIEEEIGVVERYGNEDYISYWNGIFRGKEYNISLNSGRNVLSINNFKINPNLFVRFKDDLDSLSGISGHTIYFTKNYVCIEGI